MNMDAIADDTFDRGYAIESTCHAPDKAGAFAEIYRVLKPGALFWGQEMCMTDKFDPGDDLTPGYQDGSDARHRAQGYRDDGRGEPGARNSGISGHRGE